MERKSKWLWAITTASLVGTMLLFAYLYLILRALAAFAASVVIWPVFVLVPSVVVLSALGIWLAKGTARSLGRVVTIVINTCVLGLALLLVVGATSLYVRIPMERFLIPEGYTGDVFVLYGVSRGEVLAPSGSTITYRIPPNGILCVQHLLRIGSRRTEYDYVLKDGTTRKIENLWATTIPRTPENLANTHDVGIFFPRNGTFSLFLHVGQGKSQECKVQFEEFYVGTKANLLNQHRAIDLGDYLRNNPSVCQQ